MESHDNEKQETDVVYKTKVVQFLGRPVPIILQNDNGPCPLLAICNVLLLRNNISLSPDPTEVASSRLLALVAERLLDANSNIEHKDEEYVRNQQQNISDAISLLHRLATGLDVNVRFKNIHDFEFTPECAVFDLLDIGLVHGWLCDPQDEATSKVIGANSYNTLVEKLVELQSRKSDALGKSDDFTEVVALKPTSPSHEPFLKTEPPQAFEEPACTEPKQRKGDAEEAAELLQALKFSEGILTNDGQVQGGGVDELATPSIPGRCSDDGTVLAVLTSTNPSSTDIFVDNIHNDQSCLPSQDVLLEEEDGSQMGQDAQMRPDASLAASSDEKDVKAGLSEGAKLTEKVISPALQDEGLDISLGLLNVKCNSFEAELAVFDNEVLNTPVPTEEACFVGDRGSSPLENSLLEPTGHNIWREEDGSADLTPSSIGSNPGASCPESQYHLYEGKVEVKTPHVGSQELPTDSLETVEAEVGITSTSPMASDNSRQQMDKDDLSIAVTEGMIIENFLRTNASQLTYYGLFCLQDGLKERELCVFFRNNHFSTMFKYNGDLFLLVTDQGYLNQADIVWEKLDEVHGDTVFVTGSFNPFRADQSSNVWNEQDVIAATADYLSSHNVNSAGAHDHNTSSSDLQLAMSLQHQEFEQQQQPRSTSAAPTPRPQPHTGGVAARPDGSRLVTGPKKSHYSSKPEPKSKCTVM